MRAVIFDSPGQVAVSDVPEPRIEQATDAIVRVQVSAICGTDLHALHGIDGIPPGTVLGHEFAGEIIALGDNVQTFRTGERVFGSDFTACGRCWWCRRGDHWECTDRSFFGFGEVFGAPLAGAQAEMIRVPHADVVLAAIPEGCDAETAIFVGDTLACGFAAAERGQVAIGDIVAIIGGGTVGQMASLACQSLGAAVIVLVEVLQARREVAGRNGAIATAPESARSVVDELTDGRGADVVIDAVGGAGPLQAACELVRPRGTVVSVGAHFDQHFAFPVARAFAEELSLSFAIGDSIRLRDGILPLLVAEVIDPTTVVTSRISLDQAPDAYQRMARHEELKVLIRP